MSLKTHGLPWGRYAGSIMPIVNEGKRKALFLSRYYCNKWIFTKPEFWQCPNKIFQYSGYHWRYHGLTQAIQGNGAAEGKISLVRQTLICWKTICREPGDILITGNRFESSFVPLKWTPIVSLSAWVRLFPKPFKTGKENNCSIISTPVAKLTWQQDWSARVHLGCHGRKIWLHSGEMIYPATSAALWQIAIIDFPCWIWRQL